MANYVRYLRHFDTYEGNKDTDSPALELFS